MDAIKMDVMGHLAGTGDVHKGSGEYVGTRGEKKPLEGFSIISLHQEGKLGVRYRATVRGAGDSAWQQDGQLAGSRGNLTVVEGLRIELYGKDLALYDIEYMAHVAEMGDTRWYANGEYCGTPGHAIEGLAVRIVPRQHNYLTLISRARSMSDQQLVVTAPHAQATVQVAVAAGEATQLWDKRPVKAGQGYVLISKAWPHKCLAHQGENNPTVLKDVDAIDRDDSCVWRDDTVAGPFNAINSWTNWELKLNMRGNRYADHGNDLLVYKWAGGAANELWRSASRTYDVVSGFDSDALNLVAGSIYTDCYPQIFKGRLDVDAGGLVGVGYDMSTQPEFSLERGAEAHERLRQSAQLLHAIIDQAGLTVDQVVDGASVTAVVRDFLLSVELQGKPVLEVSSTLTIGATIRANANRSLSLQLVLGDLVIPEHPWLEPLLKEFFVPPLLAFLNKEILHNIEIPALEFKDVRLAMPVVATRYPHALASTTQMPDFAAPPPEGAWPRKKVFAAIDASLLEAVAMAELKAYAPHGDWKNSQFIKTSAQYHVSFDAVRVDLKADAGNTYHVQIRANAGASLTIDPPVIPAFSVGASAYGNIGATASVEINHLGEVVVIIRSLDPVMLNWSLDGVPGFIQAPIMSMFNLFTSTVATALTQSLRGVTFKVYSVPVVEATIADRKFSITFEKMELSSIADKNGKPLVLGSTVPRVNLIG